MMKKLVTATNARLGAWIVSIGQILLQEPLNEDTARMAEIIDASKAGKLLQTISADSRNSSDSNQISAKKMFTYGLSCKIGQRDINSYLDKFKSYGMVDFDILRTEYRVISRDKFRMLDTVYRYFDESESTTNLERIAIHLMEFLNDRPKTRDELFSFGTSTKIADENDLKIIFRILESYGIISRAEDGAGGIIYYSYFQNHSEGYEAKIGQLIKILNDETRAELDKMISSIYGTAGLLKASCGVSDDTINLAVSLGLIEVITVNRIGSGLGSAEFVMPPALKTRDENQSVFENDVFHNAKLLLSPIRFGEQKSTAGRGRIIDPIVLMNRLLEDNEVGPCTAIGQDYGILELEGVIETTRATNRPGEQYSMYLGKREPAHLVKSLLEKGFRSKSSSGSIVQEISFPMQFNPPEVYRKNSTHLLSKSVSEAKLQLMFALRTS